MPLDIAAGIFISFGLAGSPGLPLGLDFVVLCVLFTLLPDLDFIFYIFREGGVTGKWAHQHRDLLHKPLIYIPIGVLFFLPFGLQIIEAFVTGSVFHFLHDAVGMGWGIKLLWPFSKKNYKFFGGEQKLFTRTFVTSWTDAELHTMVSARNDENWIKQFYLRPHPLGIFEYVMLVLSLGALFFALQ